MKVVIEDTEIEIEDELAAEGDAAILAALVPHYPDAAGAEVSRRKDKEGEEYLDVTPVGKTKGSR